MNLPFLNTRPRDLFFNNIASLTIANFFFKRSKATQNGCKSIEYIVAAIEKQASVCPNLGLQIQFDG